MNTPAAAPGNDPLHGSRTPAPYNPPDPKANPPAVNKPVNYTAGINPLSPEGGNLIKVLAASKIIPTAFRGQPDSILVVWLYGSRVGLDVFSSMVYICEINGKPTIYGDGALAVCMQNPRWKAIEESYDRDNAGRAQRALCRIRVKTQEKPIDGEFTLQQAADAGLLRKAGPWTQYPERMLMMRARAYAIRTAFPDSLAGFHLTEEILGSTLGEAGVMAIDGEPPKATMKAQVDAKVAEAETKVTLPTIVDTGEVVHRGEETVITVGKVVEPEVVTVTREALIKRARELHDAGNVTVVGSLVERYKVKRLSLIHEDDIPRAVNWLDDFEERQHTFPGAGT